MLVGRVKHRCLLLGTSLGLALVVALGGASRRLTVAFESVAQNIARGDGRARQETRNADTLNPSLFDGEQDKSVAACLDKMPPAVADGPMAHPQLRAVHLTGEFRWASRAKLLSLQASFVRLQV